LDATDDAAGTLIAAERDEHLIEHHVVEDVVSGIAQARGEAFPRVTSPEAVLCAEIAREDPLRLHRLARIWREPVGLTVNRLIRRGLHSYRGEYSAEEVADLPRLPPLPPRKRHSRPSVGLVQLEAASPGETATTIAAAELVREAMNGGDGA
jgi:hypothetical protein